MAIAIGVGFSLVLVENGDVYVMGQNDSGQLGLGHEKYQELPILLDRHQVFDGEAVTMLSAADSCSACVTEDGSLWTWGMQLIGQEDPNDEEQFGMDTETLFSCASLPVRTRSHLFGGSPALMVSISESDDFMMLLTAAGHVWSCGLGDHEFPDVLRLIDPTLFSNEPVGMISTGMWHIAALSRDGASLWTWGRNHRGQLGLHPEVDHSEYVAVPTRHETESNASYASGFAFVDCGRNLTMVVTVDGVLFGCGCNYNDELGLTERRDYGTFQRVGGSEVFGQAGGVRTVSCGFCQTLIVTKDNSIWACGEGSCPSIDLEDTTSFRIMQSHPTPDDFNYADVTIAAAGYSHSCLVTAQGLLYTWGDTNACHGLGYSNTQFDTVSAENRWRPHVVNPAALGGACVGRWHSVHQDRVLAMAMAQHWRLGGEAHANSFPEGLMFDMFQGMRFAPRAEVSRAHRARMGLLPTEE